ILALTEERQFLRASEVCFVTQPTLSMQVKKAETALGTLVFDRSTSPLELTSFGESLVPIIRDVLNEYEQIEVLIQKKKGVFKERLRVAIIPTIAGYLLPDLFRDWRDALIDVQLSIEEMKTEEILIALENKQIDIGILAGPVNDPKLRSSIVYREEIRAYLPNVEKDEVTTTNLVEYHPWLLTQGNCLRTQMINFCELNKGGKDEWNYEGGNMNLLEELVELHVGYTLIPQFAIKNNSKDYKRIRSVTGEVPAREVIALTPNRSSKWSVIEKLIRSMQLKYGNDQTDEFKMLSWK
ncbi:MAG: LysR substrate-binding domain-containing protein, partial [Crocinitomicaceae bacterium]|nr:LysR substrate-binding domain-containing protein [Crocinitomicaceae bacterium]